ncbi:unnamed protein product [Ambrosiozyma monospora]|uniref:Unnamed protein product n=1 Tax=Ambrosiozyma monospora TaxID=43982 RepID=A0A9W6YTZ7_AMBMO|nr:unnamed protein product [Ambrosiozyma monospora]
MSASTRLSIHWPQSEGLSPPSEKTSTLVLTSPEGRFVDVRPLLHHPGLKSSSSETLITDYPFEWAFAGHEIDHGQVEVEIDGELTKVAKIEFDHKFFDDVFIHRLTEYYHIQGKGEGEGKGEGQSSGMKTTETAKRPIRSEIATDVGFFQVITDPDASQTIGGNSSLANSPFRRETGEMQNPKTDHVEPYVEIWKSLIEISTTSSSSSSSCCCSSSSSSSISTSNNTTKLNCCVWDIVSEKPQNNTDIEQGAEAMSGYEGRVISFGPWTQGLLWNKARSADTGSGEPISVIRRFDAGKGKLKCGQVADESGIEIDTIEFGLDVGLFPRDSQLGLTRGGGSCNVGDDDVVVVSGEGDGGDCVRWRCVECWKSCDLKL